MKGQILLFLITLFAYVFLCYDAITRLRAYQIVVIIHVVFYTFVFIFATSHLFKKNKD